MRTKRRTVNASEEAYEKLMVICKHHKRLPSQQFEVMVDHFLSQIPKKAGRKTNKPIITSTDEQVNTQ